MITPPGFEDNMQRLRNLREEWRIRTWYGRLLLLGALPSDLAVIAGVNLVAVCGVLFVLATLAVATGLHQAIAFLKAAWPQVYRDDAEGCA